jgi:hypothetical protein
MKYWVLTIIIGTLILFRPLSDPDFGWHYKYGEHFVLNHTTSININPFSYTFSNYHWANSYWLSEIFFYLAFNIYPALASLSTSFLLSITLWLSLKNKKYHIGGKILATVLIVLISTIFSTSVRPMIFSSILLISLINILTFHKNYIKFLPLLFLLWANIHADFTLGLMILGLYTLLSLIRIIWEYTKMHNIKLTINNILETALWPLLAVVITVINPYGLDLFNTLLKETHFFQFNYIREWLPLFYNYNLAKPYELIGILISYSLVITAVVTYRKRIDIWHLIAFFIFFILSIKSIYFSRIMIILAMYPTAMFWGDVIEKFPKYFQTQHRKLVKLFSIYIMLVISLCTVGLAIRTMSTYVSNDAFCKFTSFPCKAVEYIKETKPEGNMFNAYNWGGYLIMNLTEYKTFIDGRMPSWSEDGDRVYVDYINITYKPQDNIDLFNRYVTQYNITWVFDYKDSKLVKYLREKENWELIYGDGIATVLAKK